VYDNPDTVEAQRPVRGLATIGFPVDLGKAAVQAVSQRLGGPDPPFPL
jgi:hypothetical protein